MMRRNAPVSCSVVTCMLVLSLVLVHEVRAEARLATEVQSTEARYCTDARGGVSLQLSITIGYQNESQANLVVPTFTRVASYILFRDIRDYQRGRIEDRVTYPPPPAVEIPKLPAAPGAPFFDILPPGGKLQRQVEVRIPVGRDKGRHAVLQGTDHYVEVVIDLWPRPRKAGEVLKQAWKDRGVLLMDKLAVGPPIRIHVDEKPRARGCWMQID